MQLSFKQSIEIAEEEAINTVLKTNKYDLTRKRLNYDLTTIGIAAVKTSFNPSEGIVIDYVDPAYMVYSYTEDPNFEDIYYVGEVKAITIPELKKQFPHISEDELYRIQQMPGNRQYIQGWGNYDTNTVQVLYFEYKTYMDQVFKIKYGENGLEKVIQKDSSFNPPKNVLKAPVRSFTICSILANSSAVCFGSMAIWPAGVKPLPFGAFAKKPCCGVSSSVVSKEGNPGVFVIVYIPLIV